MIGHSNTRNILASAALAFIVIAPMAPTSASAQGLSWLWGGGSEVGGSGKEVVAFGAQHRPGQIIVSFTDRRLYFVTRPGEALSYPIASPRDQSRWQGTLQVSSKRVDPPWTPDRRNDQGKPEAAAARTRWPPDESDGCPGALSRRDHVPDPRHRRALVDRAGRLQGLHSHV